ALDRINGAPGVGDSLPFGRVADKDLALVGEGDDTGGQAVAFEIRNNFNLAPFHDRHDGIRGAQINADNSFASCSHFCLSFSGLNPITARHWTGLNAFARPLQSILQRSQVKAKRVPSSRLAMTFLKPLLSMCFRLFPSTN